MGVTVGGVRQTEEEQDLDTREGRDGMVDWDSPDFGGHVTRAADGSWSMPDDKPEPEDD